MGAMSLPSSTLLSIPTKQGTPHTSRHGLEQQHILRSLLATKATQTPIEPSAMPSTLSILSLKSGSTPSRSQRTSSRPIPNSTLANRVSSSKPTIASTPVSASQQSTSHNDNAFTTTALASILAAIAFLLISAFVLGFILRRHKRKEHWKRIEESTRSKPSPKLNDLTSNGIRIESSEDIKECKGNGMGRIFVTREIKSRNSVLREEDGWEKHVNFEVNGARL